jgi:pilus assembly protein CpaC
MVRAISEGARHARGSKGMRRAHQIAMVLVVSAFGLILAELPAAAANSRTIPVAIRAGKTYTISGIARDSTPGVQVLENPHAMVVNSDAPGKMTVVGTEPGSWDITVTLADGEKVTYAVSVKSDVAAASAAEPGDAGSGEVSAGSVSAKPDADASAALESAKIASSPSGSGAKASAAPAASASSTSTAALPVARSAHIAPVRAEPVKIASADPTTSATSGASAISPAAVMPKPAAAYPVVAAATPVAGSSSAPAASATSSPGSSGPGSPMTPSQTASAVQAPIEKFHANPPAMLPAPLPPSGEKHFLPDNGIDLMAGTSQVIDFPTRIRRVSIADSKIADIQVINPYELNLVGHQSGFTTLAVWDAQGRYVQRQVRVDTDGKQQVLLNVIVAELNRANTEAFGVNFTAALPRWNISLVNMAGGVATAYQPSSSLTANALISSNPPVTVSTSATGTLPPGGTLIPLLLSQNMTYGLAAQNNNITTQSFFQFLEAHDLAKILAEPRLLANSGEKAQFLSGGEIPIVIAQALNTSIVFKQFGTSVDFVPTVVGRDDIELKVKPEVSEPDYAHGVQLFGFTVPAFVTRRAETMVRLKNNQTLIIAGLLLNERNEEVKKVPYLGDIPWVRGLFRNTSYSNMTTDLVMTVTPQLVAPVPVNGQVVLPTDRGPMSSEEIKTRRVYPPDAARPRF